MARPRWWPSIPLTYRPDPLEDVHIAYSLDGGRTFCQYAGNPVIHVGSADEREPKFGDPKVFWHAPSSQWIMVKYSEAAPRGHVAIYGSLDPAELALSEPFRGPRRGAWCLGNAPTCSPWRSTAIHRKNKWVLKVNICRPGNGTRYFVGCL